MILFYLALNNVVLNQVNTIKHQQGHEKKEEKERY
jgi:hypothetical protein